MKLFLKFQLREDDTDWSILILFLHDPTKLFMHHMQFLMPTNAIKIFQSPWNIWPVFWKSAYSASS